MRRITDVQRQQAFFEAQAERFLAKRKGVSYTDTYARLNAAHDATTRRDERAKVTTASHGATNKQRLDALAAWVYGEDR